MLPSPSELRTIFDYDALSGELCWRSPTSRRVKVGAIAGNLDKDGYMRLGIGGVSVAAQRVIWAYVHGEWPATDVDHENGRRADNTLTNLRLASRSQNNCNSKRRLGTRSGFKGVSWSDPGQNWKARVKVNGRDIHLGCFNSPEEAHAAYIAAAKLHYGEFARAA